MTETQVHRGLDEKKNRIQFFVIVCVFCDNKSCIFLLLFFFLYHFQVSDLDDEAGSPTEEFKAFAGDSGMNRSQSEYCNVGSKTSLTNHPAKKYVFDFMRVLIMDNMCMTPASKQTPIVDMLLEVRRSI